MSAVGTVLDWKYTTESSSIACLGSGGICRWPRGKMVAGSSGKYHGHRLYYIYNIISVTGTFSIFRCSAYGRNVHLYQAVSIYMRLEMVSNQTHAEAFLKTKWQILFQTSTLQSLSCPHISVLAHILSLFLLHPRCQI